VRTPLSQQLDDLASRAAPGGIVVRCNRVDGTTMRCVCFGRGKKNRLRLAGVTVYQQ